MAIVCAITGFARFEQSCFRQTTNCFVVLLARQGVNAALKTCFGALPLRRRFVSPRIPGLAKFCLGPQFQRSFVIMRPLLRVAQSFIGLKDICKGRFDLRSQLRRALVKSVRMELQRERTIFLLDFVIGCVPCNAEHFIQISGRPQSAEQMRREDVGRTPAKTLKHPAARDRSRPDARDYRTAMFLPSTAVSPAKRLQLVWL